MSRHKSRSYAALLILCIHLVTCLTASAALQSPSQVASKSNSHHASLHSSSDACHKSWHPETNRHGFCLDDRKCCLSSSFFVHGLCGGDDICCYSADQCTDEEFEADHSGLDAQQKYTAEGGNGIEREELKQRTEDVCRRLKLVRRSQWGAIDPSQTVPMLATMPPARVFIHHTGQREEGEQECLDASTCASHMRALQTYHQSEKGWWDVGYSFVISPTGHIFEGRGWVRQGAHTLNYNAESVGVALMGDFRNTSPAKAQISALRDLIVCGEQRGLLAANYSLHAHSHARCTSCPGDGVQELISRWPHYQPGRLSKYSCPQQHAYLLTGISDMLDNTLIIRKRMGPRNKVINRKVSGRRSWSNTKKSGPSTASTGKKTISNRDRLLSNPDVNKLAASYNYFLSLPFTH